MRLPRVSLSGISREAEPHQRCWNKRLLDDNCRVRGTREALAVAAVGLEGHIGDSRPWWAERQSLNERSADKERTSLQEGRWANRIEVALPRQEAQGTHPFL